MAIDPNAVPAATDGSVPAQNSPSPSTMPAPPIVSNTADPASPPPIIGSPTVAQSGPIVAAGTNMSAGSKPSLARKVLQAVSGGETQDFVQNPGGPTEVNRNLTGGELARRVLASVGSLFAAGIGGLEAEKQGRPFQLAPGTSLGEIQNAPVEQRRQQAQQTFANTQAADEMTLRAHKDAMEQQESIAKLQNYTDVHNAAIQARTLDPLRNTVEIKELNQRMFDIDTKNTQDYNKALAMPGAQVMTDDKGNELNFASGEEAKAYVVAHPETIHGRTSETTKFGVIPVINPYTGSYQIVDYPPDRHDVGLANFGQKKNPDGSPMFDAQGNPVPDGTVLDPKSKRPTVLTQTVTPDQARTIAAQGITQADTVSLMQDRQAQARLRDSEVKKNQELSDAVDAYNMGNFAKMSDRQKALVARMTFQEQTLAANRQSRAEENLNKVRSLSGNNENDPNVKSAEAELAQAQADHDDAQEKYNQLTDNTAGKQMANAIIRQGIGDRPWSATTPDQKPILDTNGNPVGINEAIMGAKLSDADRQRALGLVWNSLSPAQKAQTNPSNGGQFAFSVVRGLNGVTTWPAITNRINNSALPDAEKATATKILQNAIPADQQAAIAKDPNTVVTFDVNKVPVPAPIAAATQNAAPAQQAAASPAREQRVAEGRKLPVPAGQTALFDAQGGRHFVDTKLVAGYLSGADPRFQGWTK
jgi:hypothetical protein